MKRKKLASRKQPGKASSFSSGSVPVLIFAWTLLIHLAFLVGSVERATPISAFFFGDSLHYLEQARHLAEGRVFNAGLPFHPPLTSWALLPLWRLLPSPEAVYLGAKILMASLNGLLFALLYVLLRRRRPRLAAPLCLLMPLSFGEILLSASVSSEVIYRLLLLCIVALGWRRPLAAGGLHAAAALTRAEHLPFILLVGSILFWRFPEHRRRLLVTAAVGLLLLVPWVVASARSIEAYNRAHADELAEPLPKWVPISFYGPLNFALAQREEGIFFSRRSLPMPPGRPTTLDPRFPPHHRLIVHGLREGLREIAEDPGRFVHRSFEKALFSARALGHGWSWRDFPKSGTWIRPPVDMAYSEGPFYMAVAIGLGLLGLWSFREERSLLVLAGVLFAYRLGMSILFFPYLRGMMLFSPFFLLFMLTGAATLFGPFARRGLIVLVIALALLHLPGAPQQRRYDLRGERDAEGSIIDDRPVTLVFRGYY